jgi:hypothetical protein
MLRSAILTFCRPNRPVHGFFYATISDEITVHPAEAGSRGYDRKFLY